MQKLLRAGILITFGMLTICIIGGCADDVTTQEVVDPPPLEEDKVDSDYSVPRAHTVKVYPDPCLPVFPDTQFTLSFDEGITAASVNDTHATGAGHNWMVMPGLEVGTARLNIEWFNRDATRRATTIGPYVVVAGPEALKSPAFTHGTVRNGEADVNPAPINASGLLFFSTTPSQEPSS